MCHPITTPLSHARPKLYTMPVVFITASNKGLMRQFEEDVQKLSTLASTKTFAKLKTFGKLRHLASSDSLLMHRALAGMHFSHH